MRAGEPGWECSSGPLNPADTTQRLVASTSSYSVAPWLKERKRRTHGVHLLQWRGAAEVLEAGGAAGAAGAKEQAKKYQNVSLDLCLQV